MAPRYRPVARLRLRVRRRVQNVVGIITGQHPGESVSVDQYYASTSTSTSSSPSSSSASFGTSRNPPRLSRRNQQQQQRRYSQIPRSKASYHSLTSINESDEEDSLVGRGRSRSASTPSSGSSSANVSVFDSDTDDYDDDEDEDGFEDTDSEISSVSEGHDGGKKPSNPFSDYYSSSSSATTGTRATTVEDEGAELTRVHARSDKPTLVQTRRANDPYNTHVSLEGARTGPARTRVQRVALPKGMKWKSTPGACYGFTTSTGAKRSSSSSSKRTGKNGRGGGAPSTSSSTSSPAATPGAATTHPKLPKIIEIPWNHTSHGAYQTLRPADRRAVRSWTSGAIAAGGMDAGTMMAMMECPSSHYSSSSSSAGAAASRLAEFDSLAGLAYGGGGGGGLGEADLQWLEYMSIPSGSLGKASRWVGRRLGLCSSSSSGSGSTAIGCGAGTATKAKGSNSNVGIGPLGAKPSLMKTATEGSKGGVVGQLAAPGAAAVRVVSAKRVRFA